MSEQLNLIKNLIDNLSIRERVLVLLGVLAVIYMLWDRLLVAPVQSEINMLINQRSNIEAQNVDLKKRQIIANGMMNNNKQKEIIKAIEQLENDIKQFDARILKSIEGQVAPENMASMLSDLLGNNQGLQLISINNLPAEPLSRQLEDKVKESEKNRQSGQSKLVKPELIGVYQHPLELELEGQYLDILAYLQALEALDWKIFWDQVSLETLQYPNVKVRIKVHTFSLKSGWLSV
jgi:MSHA biogenesis protein MshJ